MPPLIIAGAIAAGGAVAGGVINSRATGKAVDAQTASADQSALLQKQAADEALAEQRRQFDVNQQNLRPYLDAGTAALPQLSELLSTGFKAPTMTQDPGYQFRLSEGMKALEKSAAARGNILTGGTAKALERYGQDYASNEYDKVYSRAFNEYLTKYNTLAGLSGTGQVAANQLNQAGQNSANNITNILTGSAANQADILQNAANARASGYLQGANTLTGSINSGIGNFIGLADLLRNRN